MNYFSTAITIGRTDYIPSQFPDPEVLLSHMDYLGVDRTLVASYGTPTLANRELLETVKAYPDRFYPVLTLYPGMIFEHGCVDFLKEQARLGNKAYIVTTGSFRLRECERLLLELKEFHPVIFVNPNNSDAFLLQDVEEMAGKFPEAFFMLGNVMWPRFGHYLDLMWRRKNVGFDISWLHTRDSIEIVIEHFGVERLFFGIGYISHYGAVIGSLAHARITQEQREAIAHGNLEKLLGIPPLDHKLAREPDFADKPLWKRFKEGKKLEGVRVYDVHAHLTGPTGGGWIHCEHTQEQAIQEMAAFMDRYGVEKIVINNIRLGMKGNRDLERIAAPYPGRFMGDFVYNPKFADEYGEAVMDEFFGRGFFTGFKLLASYWKIPYNDPGYVPVWEYAEKHHLPILMHTWGDVKDLTGIPEKYPHAKFIIGHSGGSNAGRLQAYELAERSENVYFEFCGTFCSNIPWQEGIERFGNHRFVFGSDTAHHNESFELSGLLSIPIPDEVLRPILGENYIRILADRV